jgi:hypothetical protein
MPVRRFVGDSLKFGGKVGGCQRIYFWLEADGQTRSEILTMHVLE